MLDLRKLQNTLIYNELLTDNANFWFDLKRSKFLYNIDTFYYSVTVCDDFSFNTLSKSVVFFREFFNRLNIEFIEKSVCINDCDFLVSCKNFSSFYNICLSVPNLCDIFIATSLPNNVVNTPQFIVQLRSCSLWELGSHYAFKKSLEYVVPLLKFFNFFELSTFLENRIDFAFHSNYLTNPEKFFDLPNFYRMRVDRFKDCYVHSCKTDSLGGYELDYLCLGKRSDKVFIRIYNKSKEVIEKGYKSFFLYIWFFNGLINRYDLFVFEECYKKGSWRFLDVARLKFYLLYGKDNNYKSIINSLISSDSYDYDKIKDLADFLCPKVTLIYNVEFQTMRKHLKSYVLFDLKEFNKIYDVDFFNRIFNIFHHQKYIVDYLTFYIFRLVDFNPLVDTNKSRCELVTFWKLLRKTKFIDCNIKHKDLHLIRDYSSCLDSEIVKNKIINSVSSFSMYSNGINDNDLYTDIFDFMNYLNDNDVCKAYKYKNKNKIKFKNI